MSDNIGYGNLIENAMMQVVRSTLQLTQEQGLPGEHHFYITFLSNHPEAVIPDFLREKYPHSLTIVLQNKYWNLDVKEDGFSVELSFNNQNSKLYVPFDGLLSFNDPSVEFALHFNSALFDEDITDFDDLPEHIQSEIEEEFLGERKQNSTPKEGKVLSFADFKNKNKEETDD